MLLKKTLAEALRISLVLNWSWPVSPAAMVGLEGMVRVTVPSPSSVTVILFAVPAMKLARLETEMRPLLLSV